MPALFFIYERQRCSMSSRQIHDVDVISDTRAVIGIVIISKHIQLWQLAHSDFGDAGHQVDWSSLGPLADQPTIVRTLRIT
jgi:hypothetical protein